MGKTTNLNWCRISAINSINQQKISPTSGIHSNIATGGRKRCSCSPRWKFWEAHNLRTTAFNENGGGGQGVFSRFPDVGFPKMPNKNVEGWFELCFKKSRWKYMWKIGNYYNDLDKNTHTHTSTHSIVGWPSQYLTILVFDVSVLFFKKVV